MLVILLVMIWKIKNYFKKESMNWFQKLFYTEPLTDKELQAKLKSLVDKMVLFYTYDDTVEYQKILEEIYNRGIKPEVTLKSKD